MEDGFLTPEQDAELRDFWTQINSMTVLNREMIKLLDIEATKKDLAEDLKAIHDDLMEWIKRVHLMAGPDRVEIREAIVEVRNFMGDDKIEVSAAFFVGDIISACTVLQERLRG